MTTENGEVILLAIDPQIDFTVPANQLLFLNGPVTDDGKNYVIKKTDARYLSTGNLFVPGADEDMKRLAKVVRQHKGVIDRIVCTTDAHRFLHTAHPIWFVNDKNEHPNPFTQITLADVTGPNPKWRATNRGYQDKMVKYIESLEAQGNYKLMVWPPHCKIGGPGYIIHPDLWSAFEEWESQFAVVDYVTKGSNIFTEHYSAFKAEVFDPEDAEGTGPNAKLVEYLQNAKRIYIAGEASSHCVKATVTDIANHFGDDYVKKFVFLKDASSPVPGFEQQAEDFIKAMVAKGMKVTTTDKFLTVL